MTVSVTGHFPIASAHHAEAALLWSGGKDSVLALHHIRRACPDLQVIRLVTCLSETYDRVHRPGSRPSNTTSRENERPQHPSVRTGELRPGCDERRRGAFRVGARGDVP